MNGSVVKTRKKETAGFTQRVAILNKYLPKNHLSGLREKAKELKCNPDDLLDAVCLAVTAALSAQGECETIPPEPEQDATGLYMKLTVPKKNTGNPANGQKVAVVTGGANGIGKCIVDEFRKQGVRVYVIDKAHGDHYVGDISDKEVLEAFARTVIRESGGIDFLINNALPIMKGIDECSYEDFQYAPSVGVTAPFYPGQYYHRSPRRVGPPPHGTRRPRQTGLVTKSTPRGKREAAPPWRLYQLPVCTNSNNIKKRL